MSSSRDTGDSTSKTDIVDSETSDSEGSDDSYVSATGDPLLPSLVMQNQLNIDPDLNLNPDMNQPTQTNEQLLVTMALLSAQLCQI